jgi:hypothetical protein
MVGWTVVRWFVVGSYWAFFVVGRGVVSEFVRCTRPGTAQKHLAVVLVDAEIAD